MTQRRGPGGVRNDQASTGLVERTLDPKHGWYCKKCGNGPQFEEPCKNCGRDMHGRLTGQTP